MEITIFDNKLWLSSPTMHGEEIKYVQEAYETNWMSTVGANINEVEKQICEKVGCKYAVALEKAFELYPDTKVIIVANLYGTPAKFDEICAIAKKHGAVIIEDAAESLGATYKGKQTGTFGTYNAISFNGNKIITGSSGGMLLTDDLEAANKARKWSPRAEKMHLGISMRRLATTTG